MQYGRMVMMGSLFAIGISAAGASLAAPVENVRPGRHPNLAAAQRLTHQAYERVVAAQQANEYDMDGHAQKAKELLDQVNVELAAAAGAANRN